MIIKELHLLHFGKFHNYVVELGPRMNLVSGANEAGKSTLFAFIFGMFFGMKRSRGRAAAADMYTRFLPWETPGNYEGLMFFEHDGKNYRLYRNFHKNSPAVSLVCLDSSKEILLPHGVIGDFIQGLTEENYRNTMGVFQGRSELDGNFALALQSQAANMALTGSGDLHLDLALDYLKKERQRVLKQSCAGQIQELNERLRRLSLEQENDAGQRRGMEKYSPDKVQELSFLQKKAKAELEECQLALGMALSEEQRLRKEMERLEHVPKGEVAPGRTSIPAGQGTQEKKSRRLWLGLGAAGMILGIVIGAAAIGNAAKGSPMLLGGSLLLCVLLLAVGIFGGMMGFQRHGNVSSKVVQKKLQKEMPKPSQKEDPKEFQKEDSERAVLVEKLQANHRQRQQLESRKAQIADRLQVLLEQEGQQRQALSRAAWEQEQYSKRQNEMEDCKDCLIRLTEAEDAIKNECFCIDQAVLIIGELAGEIHESFGSPLWEKAAQFMEAMTGNRQRFRVSRDLKISVDNSKTYVPIERLSRGTMEQLFLALRLGAAELLFGGQSVPLLLDDTFAYYDDGRLGALLEWLGTKPQGQAILLSCHHREGMLMDERNIDYNYVNLDEQ